MNDIIKIINEEIEAFNFLDHEKLIKEDKYNSILSTPKFTSNFINDVVNNFKTKIKFDKTDVLDSTINDEDIVEGDEPLNIEYTANIKYLMQDNKYITLGIGIDGENVTYKLGSSHDKGDYLTPSYSDVWFEYLNWDGITVKLFNKDFDVINDNLLANVDDQTAERFIMNFIAPYFSIRTK